MTERRVPYQVDRPERFEISAADVQGMSQAQAFMAGEIAEHINVALWQELATRTEIAAVLRLLSDKVSVSQDGRTP